MRKKYAVAVFDYGLQELELEIIEASNVRQAIESHGKIESLQEDREEDDQLNFPATLEGIQQVLWDEEECYVEVKEL